MKMSFIGKLNAVDINLPLSPTSVIWKTSFAKSKFSYFILNFRIFDISILELYLWSPDNTNFVWKQLQAFCIILYVVEYDYLGSVALGSIVRWISEDYI